MATEQITTPPVAPVSVVMATFNGAGYLDEQLRSILQQTIKPSEIIVCDDGSTDDTTSILEKWKNTGAPIRYTVNEKRLGVVGNFKKAVAMATGNYIALADQDDIWLPEKIEKLYHQLVALDDGSKPAIIHSGMIVINKDGTLLNPSFWNQLGQDVYEHCFETLLFGNFVTGCSLMMNRKMQNHFTSMPPNVPMHDAWIALIAYSIGRAAEIKEPLMKYRRHDTNVSFGKDHQKKNRIQRLATHLRSLVMPNNYLEDQLDLVEMFNERYHRHLAPLQAEQVKRFLSLKDRSYLRKLIAFRAFFRPHWH
jgi:glycosyltransferase involved in cell wall biosynthesis